MNNIKYVGMDVHKSITVIVVLMVIPIAVFDFLPPVQMSITFSPPSNTAKSAPRASSASSRQPVIAINYSAGFNNWED
jgi:hypothetical protein